MTSVATGVLRTLLKAVTALVPVKSVRRRMRSAASVRLERWRLDGLHRRLDRIARGLGSRPGKIRVGFFVIFDSIFPARTILMRLLADPRFEASIIVIPDVSRGREHMVKTYASTYESMVSEFGDACQVVDTRTDPDGGGFRDVASALDVVVASSPYDSNSHESFRLRRLSVRGVLTVLVSYGYYVSAHSAKQLFATDAFQHAWRVFADTPQNVEDLRAASLVGGRNVRLTGFCRMDEFQGASSVARSRRRIIVAPHHSVAMRQFQLSNFLRFSAFFATLPERYPQIDWVFRPHPLLFVSLVNAGLWTQAQADDYLVRLRAFPNLEYQRGGSYLQTFAQADGMIHDCGSFIAEFMFTGKPTCYLLHSGSDGTGLFNALGLACLARCYRATEEAEIVRYIENVVLGGDDPLCADRAEFVKDSLAVNHPHAADACVSEIVAGISKTGG